MRIVAQRLQRGLVLALGISAAAAGWASNSGYAQASAGAGMSQYNPPFDSYGNYPAEIIVYDQPNALPVNGSILNSAAAGGATGFSSVSYMATAGGLHITAVASASGSGSAGWGAGGSGQAYAGASTSDVFTILAPNQPLGTLLTVTARLYTEGSTGAMGSAGTPGAGNYDSLSSWNASVTIWNASMVYALNQSLGSSSCWSSVAIGADCSSNSAFGDVFVQFTVANGANTSMVIGGEVRARSFAGADGPNLASSNAWSDLGHTIGWGGITALTTAGGLAVGEFSALSAATGFDYSKTYVSAVPEASSALLLLTGMWVLAMIRFGGRGKPS